VPALTEGHVAGGKAHLKKIIACDVTSYYIKNKNSKINNEI